MILNLQKFRRYSPSIISLKMKHSIQGPAVGYEDTAPKSAQLRNASVGPYFRTAMAHGFPDSASVLPRRHFGLDLDVTTKTITW